jgi:splicing factor 3B subunit 1
MYDYLISDIEAQIRDLQSRKKDLIEEMKEKERVGLGESGFYDRDIYDSGVSKYDGYVTSIAVNDEMEVCNNLWINFVQSSVGSL